LGLNQRKIENSSIWIRQRAIVKSKFQRQGTHYEKSFAMPLFVSLLTMAKVNSAPSPINCRQAASLCVTFRLAVENEAARVADAAASDYRQS
jgi:hypothetical protein